jgi:hypothetical protein
MGLLVLITAFQERLLSITFASHALLLVVPAQETRPLALLVQPTSSLMETVAWLLVLQEKFLLTMSASLAQLLVQHAPPIRLLVTVAWLAIQKLVIPVILVALQAKP